MGFNSGFKELNKNARTFQKTNIYCTYHTGLDFCCEHVDWTA